MSALIRCFTYNCLSKLPVNPGSSVYSTDSVAVFKQPYMGRQAITANTGTAQSTSSGIAPKGSQIMRLEIEEGKWIAYEVNSPNRSVAADNSSPRASGSINLEFGEGYTVSILEIAVS